MSRKWTTAFLASLLLLSCRRDGIIPEGTMADIYRDIYVADLYLSTHQVPKKQADTTLVYEAIFKRYGYTSDDYIRSTEHYLREPGKFAKALRPALAELKKRETELEKEVARLKNLRFRWELLDTLPRLASPELSGNGYYRYVYQIFYRPDTLLFRSPERESAERPHLPSGLPDAGLTLYGELPGLTPYRTPLRFGYERDTIKIQSPADTVSAEQAVPKKKELPKKQTVPVSGTARIHRSDLRKTGAVHSTAGRPGGNYKTRNPNRR